MNIWDWFILNMHLKALNSIDVYVCRFHPCVCEIYAAKSGCELGEMQPFRYR